MAEFGFTDPTYQPDPQQGYSSGPPPSMHQPYGVQPGVPAFPQPPTPSQGYMYAAPDASQQAGYQNMYAAPDASQQAGFQNIAWYQPTTDATMYQNQQGGASMTFMHGNAFDDEPPLLEELGIDIKAIMLKTRAILTHRTNSIHLDDLDMGGALLFVFLLGGIHLMTGKWHMGVILGWSVVQSIVLWWIASQIAGTTPSADSRKLDVYYTCCMVGYCMIPQLLYSAFSLLLRRGPLSVMIGVLTVFWSGVTAAKLLARRAPGLSRMLPVLTYACSLLYANFALLTAY